jgi:hypothetical protein
MVTAHERFRDPAMSTFTSLDGERLYLTDEKERRRLCFELGEDEPLAGAVQIRVVANPESFLRMKEIAYRLSLDEARQARDFLASVVDRLEARAAEPAPVRD